MEWACIVYTVFNKKQVMACTANSWKGELIDLDIYLLTRE
jgi:hypothetical protein